MTPDHINGVFEALGAVLLFIDVLALRRDRVIAGVHWGPRFFFWAGDCGISTTTRSSISTGLFSVVVCWLSPMPCGSCCWPPIASPQGLVAPLPACALRMHTSTTNRGAAHG